MSGRTRFSDVTESDVPTAMGVASAGHRIENEAGAYEGLSAVFFSSSPVDGHGLIFEGEPPPMGEFPE